MSVGRLEMVRQPLTFTVDSWGMRRRDLGLCKPVDFAVVSRDQARSAVLQSIGRIASEGDEFGRLDNPGNPVAAQAERHALSALVTTDNLSVHFATPAVITWGGGGVQIQYLSSNLDFRL
jgi:hypothetical protein